jgi:hypothetical protein
MNHITFALKALALITVLSLGACATKTQSGIGTAVTTPLNDLNIVHSDIPEVLQQAQKQPYSLPASQGCDAISVQVKALDEVLGADLDVPASDANPGLIERGADLATNSAIGALQRTAEGIVPFRSWVRKLSGAERYSKRVSAAIAAGTVRRAFLKGFGASHGCSYGAQPELTAAAAQ